MPTRDPSAPTRRAEKLQAVRRLLQEDSYAEREDVELTRELEHFYSRTFFRIILRIESRNLLAPPQAEGDVLLLRRDLERCTALFDYLIEAHAEFEAAHQPKTAS